MSSSRLPSHTPLRTTNGNITTTTTTSSSRRGAKKTDGNATTSAGKVPSRSRGQRKEEEEEEPATTTMLSYEATEDMLGPAAVPARQTRDGNGSENATVISTPSRRVVGDSITIIPAAAAAAPTSTINTNVLRKGKRGTAKEVVSWRRSPLKIKLNKAGEAMEDLEDVFKNLASPGASMPRNSLISPGVVDGGGATGCMPFPESPKSQSELRPKRQRPSLLGACLVSGANGGAATGAILNSSASLTQSSSSVGPTTTHVEMFPLEIPYVPPLPSDASQQDGEGKIIDDESDAFLLAALERMEHGGKPTNDCTPPPTSSFRHVMVGGTTTTTSSASDRLDFERAARQHALLPPPEGSLAVMSASSAPPGVFSARFKVQDTWESARGKTLRLICKSRRVQPSTTTQSQYQLCLLTDSWAHSPVRAGDVINIVWTTTTTPSPADKDPLSARFMQCQNQITISDHENFLVLRPDVLISPTSIADSNSCLRRTVLKERMIIEPPSPETVLGNLRHDLFEKSLKGHAYDMDAMTACVKDVTRAPKNVEAMFAVSLKENDAIEELDLLVPGLSTWGASHFSGTRLEFGVSGPAVSCARIHKVVATEDSIVSPMWGLKARMDATVLWAFEENEFVISTLELKTGRVQRVEHRAQVTLYSLLVADRYMGNLGAHLPICGVLVHADAKTGFVTSGVTRRHGELRDLMMLRNRLVASRTVAPPPVPAPPSNDGGVVLPPTDDLLLPPPDQDDKSHQDIPSITGNISGECERCFNRDVCLLQHVVTEKRAFADMNLSTGAYEDTLGHLTPAHLAYFERWNSILIHEERCAQNLDKEIWRLTGPERELRGRCVSGLRLCLTSKTLDNGDIELTRKGGAPIRFGELSMEVGDSVIIGVDGAHPIITQGVLLNITTFSVMVRAKLMKLPPSLETSDQWRVDKHESGFTERATKHTLVTFLLKPKVSSRRRAAVVEQQDGELTEEDADRMRKFNHDMHLRSLIIDNRSPRFYADVRGKSFSMVEKLLARCGTPEEVRFGLSRGRVDENTSPRQRDLASDFANLTDDQKHAVVSILAAKDYLLVGGVPGAGKTTMVAFVVRMLWILGRSVLVTSYTHGALDNLLLKIKEQGVPVVRVQNANQCEKLHPNLRDSMLGGNTEELENAASQENLVAGFTCLATMRHPLLSRRRFDYCIVDEAGQLTEMVALGPMRCADVSILIGDKNQLPPLVKSEEAKRMRMDVSLFERLADAHPTAVVHLNTQFRMNRDINTLANELIYKGRLKCGSKEIEFRRLRAPNFPGNITGWLVRCVDPDKAVVFVNTDALGVRGREQRLDGGGITHDTTSADAGLSSPSSQNVVGGGNGTNHQGVVVNECEALLTHHVIDQLARCGTPLGDVAVISPYRAQLRILRRKLVDVVEVCTVDRFQGRDKACVIINLVRSNAEKDVGTLLLDWRRLNVAFTRAKCKLIVFGSASTLASSPICSSFLKIMERRGWAVHLPSHALNKLPGLR